MSDGQIWIGLTKAIPDDSCGSYCRDGWAWADGSPYIAEGTPWRGNDPQSTDLCARLETNSYSGAECTENHFICGCQSSKY